MRIPVARALLCLMAASAQTPPKLADWETATELDKVDFSGLSAVKKKAALKELRAEPCLCGCGMKIAECRVKDPQCGDSRGLADVIVKAIRDRLDPQYEVTHSELVARRTGTSNIIEKSPPMTLHCHSS